MVRVKAGREASLLVLGERVTDVRESKQLVNNPCRLVSPGGRLRRDDVRAEVRRARQRKDRQQLVLLQRTFGVGDCHRWGCRGRDRGKHERCRGHAADEHVGFHHGGATPSTGP